MIRQFLAAFVIAMQPLALAAFETRATAAYVIDQTTGTILLAKNADTPLPPASMSKLMTLYMAFEALEKGVLTLDEKLPVSKHAQSYGGSTMFLEAGERVAVEDLIRGIIVLSGNDACAVIAERLGGTEAKFAHMMTQRAQQLGMTSTTMTNSNGWPKPGHRMSMRDLGLLANLLITEFPQFYPLFSQKEFLFDPKESQNRFNRNPLLGLGIGADGLKTGHTNEAGYGLVGSAKQGDRRIIFAISGLQSAEARAQESEAIVNWAFRQFAQTQLGVEGQKVAEANVTLGAERTVGLELATPLDILVPTMGVAPLKAEVIYEGPVRAPISKGQEIGEIVVQPEGLPETRVKLLADRDVAPYGFGARMQAAAKHLLMRLNAGPESAL